MRRFCLLLAISAFVTLAVPAAAQISLMNPIGAGGYQRADLMMWPTIRPHADFFVDAVTEQPLSRLTIFKLFWWCTPLRTWLDVDVFVLLLILVCLGVIR